MGDKLEDADLDAVDAAILRVAGHRPRFLFSQRERARRAAIAAHEGYQAECDAWRAQGHAVVPEYWGHVINAALAALETDATQQGETSMHIHNVADYAPAGHTLKGTEYRDGATYHTFADAEGKELVCEVEPGSADEEREALEAFKAKHS